MLSESDKQALRVVFDGMPNAMLMDIVRMVENLIQERRFCLTTRRRYCNEDACERRIREIM